MKSDDGKTTDQVRLQETLPVGTRLGKYEILARLGRGGMATIYRARDTLLNRIVAIKQIGAHLADDPRWRERFRKEAQCIARVAADTRFVVSIHELVEDSHGLFIVMEFVDGHTVETLIRENRIDLALGLDILGGVCLGLRAVHAAGIVHRDIKPANVIVQPDRRVKITDFGVAAEYGGDSSMALGTTKYMAPELFTGGPIDGRVDIYSLGLVAFEMFAGREAFLRMFAGLLSDARSEALRWMNWHTRMDQPLPRLDAINPAVPPILADMVAQMAAKSLSVRYSDVNAIIADLKRYFTAGGSADGWAARPKGETGTQVESRLQESRLQVAPTGAGGDAFEPEAPTAALPKKAGPTRRRTPLMLAACGLLAFAGLVAWGLSRGPDPLDEMKQLSQQGRQAYEARRFDQALTLWKQADGRPAAGRDADAGRRVLAQWIPLAEAQVALSKDDLARAEERLHAAEQQGTRGREIDNLRDEITRQRARADATAQFEKLLEGEELETAAALIRDLEATNTFDAATLEAMSQTLSDAQGQSSYFAKLRDAQQALARNDFRAALESAQAAERKQPTDEVRAFIAKVNAERQYADAMLAARQAEGVRDFKSAVEQIEAAIRIKPSAAGEQELRRVRVRQHAVSAEAAAKQGQLAEAYEQFRLAYQLDPSPEIKREMDQLSQTVALQEQIDRGQKAADAGDWPKALQVWQSVIGTAPPDCAEELRLKIGMAQLQVAVSRGDRLVREKKWDAAKAAYEEAIHSGGGDEVRERLRQLDVERAVSGLLDRAEAARKTGQYSEAIRLYQEAKKQKPGDPVILALIDEANYLMFKTSGIKNMSAGNYRAALADFSQARRLKPDDAELDPLIAEARKKISDG